MSGRRKELLVNNEIYHVFNRTNGNIEIFSSKRIFKRALDLIDYYRYPQQLSYSKFRNSLSPEEKKLFIKRSETNEPLVEIFAFAFMPDHFHFLLKQKNNEGIRLFLSNFQNGLAKYFNKLEDRNGSLFQKSFKAKRISKDEILLHISRYIHLNPVTSYLIKYDELRNYVLTSYPYYLGIKVDDLLNSDFILKIVGSQKNYETFVANQIDYQRKLAKIKSFLLE